MLQGALTPGLQHKLNNKPSLAGVINNLVKVLKRKGLAWSQTLGSSEREGGGRGKGEREAKI